MVFHGEADQGPEINPGDVVFAIRTAPHPQFRRDANQVDLHYIMHITLLEVRVVPLAGCLPGWPDVLSGVAAAILPLTAY